MRIKVGSGEWQDYDEEQHGSEVGNFMSAANAVSLTYTESDGTVVSVEIPS